MFSKDGCRTVEEKRKMGVIDAVQDSLQWMGIPEEFAQWYGAVDAGTEVTLENSGRVSKEFTMHNLNQGCTSSVMKCVIVKAGAAKML